MTRTQIDYFLEVAKHCSFSKAANNLYVSQPAVSKQIALLENELGITLFDRADKNVRLTEAGIAFRNFQNRYDRDLNTLVSRAKSGVSSAYHGTISIGCRATWNVQPLSRNLFNVFSYWPDINIRLSGHEASDIISLVRSGEIDFGIVYGLMGAKQNDLASVPFANCGLDLLYSSDFIGESGAPTLQDFADVEFLMVDNTVGEHIKHYTESICESHGFTPRFRHYKTMAGAIMDVCCNRGAMVVDSSEIARTNSVFRHLPLDGGISVELIYSPKNPTPLKDFFVSEVQNKIKSEPSFSFFI